MCQLSADSFNGRIARGSMATEGFLLPQVSGFTPGISNNQSKEVSAN